MKTLLYVGLNNGDAFSSLYRNYDLAIGLEPNKKLYQKLVKRFKGEENVLLINAAATTSANETQKKLIIYDNRGASSSFFKLKEEWHQKQKKEIKIESEMLVDCVYLPQVLKENKIEFINDYVSDIEGMDLEVLKTLNHWINKKKIHTITCEVSKTKDLNRHVDCPDNSKEGFEKLLKKNYDLVATGYAPLRDGAFRQIPDTSWSMDCKWKRK